MMHYKYHLPTGRILSTITAPADELQFYAAPDLSFVGYVQGTGELSHYVTGGAVTPRPANPTTRAGNILSNVPVPAVVRINGTPFDTADAQVDLGLTLPGTYTVTVSAFPYLDAAFTIVIQ